MVDTLIACIPNPGRARRDLGANRIRFNQIEIRNSGMPFEPGQSGNPGGRPKSNPDLKAACRALTEKVLAAWTAALDAPGERVSAGDRIMAYGYGKPVARIEHRIIRTVGDLTDEELAGILASVQDETSGQGVVH